MRCLLLAISALMLLIPVGWGQTSPNYEAHASVAAHRREARKHEKKQRQRRHARRHHRKHQSA